MPDPRLTPARPDVAAKYLEGKVTAKRFVDGESFEVTDAIAPLRREPSPQAALETEALKGERVTIYDRNGEGWAWGQLDGDGYVGWLPDRALAKPGAVATHKVTALRTLIFPGPSIKLPPIGDLTFGARISISRQEGDLAVTREGGYLPPQHLVELHEFEHDFVTVAERFIGTPYLWGGKSCLGIDCSGLVQIGLQACGIACPRDTDMQEADLGRTLSGPDANTLQRGDLIFWEGHVAIARDADTIVHANAFHMATAIETARAAIDRIGASGLPVRRIKRLI